MDRDDMDIATLAQTTTSAPAPQTWSNSQMYHEIASALNNGAFAVLIMAMIAAYFTRNFFKQAVNSYSELMGTLKKAVENNSKALDRLADSQTRMVDILADFRHSPYGASILKELERQARELRAINEGKEP